MSKCLVVENRKGKILPACKQELSGDKRATYQCPIHCRSKLRGERKGKLCSNRHIKGKHGCRMHGGKQHVGLASKKLKHGRYSRYLTTLKEVSPEEAKLFEEIRSNPAFLSVAPDIYMMQTRIERLVFRAHSSGETGDRWRAAKKAFNDFMVAQEVKDRKASVTALGELSAALSAGVEEYDAWDEVKDLWKMMKPMMETERRRELEFSEVVQTTFVLHILKNLADSVKRNVTDQKALEAITLDIARCTGGAIRSVSLTRTNGGAGDSDGFDSVGSGSKEQTSAGSIRKRG